MTTHKNFKGIEKTVYGRGSFDQLADILAPHRTENEGYFVFLVDNYFTDKPLSTRVPAQENDLTYYISVEEHEPTTEQIDTLRDEILAKKGLPSGVVGIGGGSLMDIAKALSLMLTNEGSSTLYQGLNLIKKPGIYHVGVPTISGTGAEVSMTAVLTGPVKKLGLKCEWTVFNQIVLDPDLIARRTAQLVVLHGYGHVHPLCRVGEWAHEQRLFARFRRAGHETLPGSVPGWKAPGKPPKTTTN